jgi:hypothetical protein
MENYPESDQEVKVVMQNGAMFRAYWDGERWYVGVSDNGYDAPLDSSLIAYWEYITDDSI